MYLCSDDHDEVCYEGTDCPMCELKVEWNEQIKEMESKINSLESEIENLQGQLDEVKAQ